MSTRLTSLLRAQIVNKAIEKSEVPKLKELYKKNMAEWVDSVWLESIGGVKGKSAIAKVNKLVDKVKGDVSDNILSDTGIFRKDWDMHLNLAGMNFRIYFCGCINTEGFPDYSNKKYVRIAPSEFVILGGHPLHEKFLELEKQKEHFENLEVTIRQNVNAVTTSVGTIKSLIELWPESRELIPDSEPDKSTGLSVQTKELNSVIGLPTKKVKI